MSGYAASGRIDRVRPRLAAPSGAPAVIPEFGTDIVSRPAAPGHSTAVVERPAASTERLAAFRDRWSQLTFYLFDPNSWR